MSSPSMVHRSGDTLVVRSVVSGDQLYQDDAVDADAQATAGGVSSEDFAASLMLHDQGGGAGGGGEDDDDLDLPQCKIKRNYACTHCDFFSQNPRSYLYHLKDVHKQKIKVYECPSCLYASKHSQKLQRHVHMVHVMNKRGNNKKIAAATAATARKKPVRRLPVVVTLPRRREADAVLTPGTVTVKTEPGIGLKSVISVVEAGPPAIPGELLTCNVCGFATRNANAMARHEKLVHLKKRFFRCTKCNYVTHMRARYTKHVKYHSMPMIKCDLCDFRTPYKWNLDRHYKNHQGDGAYKCSICNFTADIKQSLTVHEMNHHVPPVGQVSGASVGRRRNKVGASDSMQTAEVEIDQEELELLRMERENDEDGEQGDGTASASQGFFQLSSPQSSKSPSNKSPRTPRVRTNFKKLAVSHSELGSDFVHPADGNVYIKAMRLRCSRCTFTAAWPGVMEQHQRTAHGQVAAKKPARPIPNLIPIGGGKSPPPQAQGGANAGTVPILRIPLVVRRVDKQMTDQDLQDIYAQSCANSSLRDFALVMGGESFDAPTAQSTPVETAVRVKNEPRSEDEDEPVDDVVHSPPSPTETPTAVTPEAAKSPSSTTPATTPGTLQGFKKKNASFFDKLKEKLLVGSGAAGGEPCDLTCWCGHESKCLSEQMRHQKLHAASAREGARGKATVGGTILTAGAELSSTRCQHCRQRCKTSADLVNHLQSCADAKRALNATPPAAAATPATTPISATTPTSATTPASGSLKSEDDDVDDDDEDVDIEDFEKKDDEEAEDVVVDGDSPEPPTGEAGPHPMENKVFVWTSLPAAGAAGAEADCEEDCLQGAASSPAASEGSLVGVETAPGYGAVTGSTAGDAAASADGKPVKKVFKCPHCTFWASTASRFHVHIVGHLNKKPFECSLCAYRSNWRWDITKHIRLKSARDVNHETAGVLMTDETGRRNYSKYNKYLTLMRVHEPSAESSGSGRRTKPGSETPSPSKLPSPPLLKRAPSPSSTRYSTGSGPLRPPPALRPATSRLRANTGHMRRPSGATDARKTLWKCKKCNFRDARRELVLAHVKEHYQQREAASQGRSSPPAASAMASAGGSERHCRLKHSGDVKVVRSPGARSIADDGSVEETSQPGSTDAGGLRHCEVCPFACLSAGEMSRHNEHHSSWPGASYRCTFCVYFVSHKRDLVSHLRLHGVADPEGHLARQRQVRANDGEDGTESPRDSAEDPADELAAGGAASKRYRCAGCPYVSNSKSQFLYHKQFHRPRGAPFKCVRCSYNVSRRHLLHQHMRVHGVVVSPVKNASPATPPNEDQDMDDNDQIEEVSLPSPRTSRSGSDNSRAAAALDTRALPDIPLVWVSRGSKFFKMYKCRFCPHVNVRKANITEHEKMHSARAAKTESGVMSPPHDGREIKREPGSTPTQHRCPDCNYVCNNAGVLSSHAKVHQGVYGEVRCLFDATRSDESQLQELVDSESMPTAPTTPQPSAQPAPQLTLPALEPSSGTKRLVFCAHCPARFLFTRELTIHARFHDASLSHRCQSCSYAARQRPHLLAHLKVHSEEYQQRTEEIAAMYPTSPAHPRPRAVLVDRNGGGGGASWVVIGGTQGSTPTRAAPYRADKHHECQLCPASFFKSVALQYHITLHGGAGPHRCRHCDYAVKTYGNLVKHEMIHGGSGGRKARVRLAQAQPMPIDGAELFRHRAEMQAQGQSGEAAATVAAPLHVDPQFGTLMHGNPQYTYPTYVKNGRLKEKRYKCHKCPSAFEKREQYKVHLSLHGSKQRYRCEKCDYSVKYYANYIQHTRKHSTGDVSRRTSAEDSDGPTSPEAPVSEQAPQRSAKSLCAARGNGPITLSVADRQSLLLQQLKRSAAAGAAGTPVEEPRSFGCPHCPYASARRDGVESHVRRHVVVSGVRGAFLCDHCDYSVPHQHFLREHNKVHFGAAKRAPPEAFMRCTRMELFLAPDKENVVSPEERTVVFADAGASATARFLPPLAPIAAASDSAAVQRKVFVNELTGEPVDINAGNVKVESVSDDEDNDEEAATDGGSPDERQEG